MSHENGVKISARYSYDWDSNSRHKFVLMQLSVWDGIPKSCSKFTQRGVHICTHLYRGLLEGVSVSLNWQWSLSGALAWHWCLAWNQNAPGMRSLMKSTTIFLFDGHFAHSCLFVVFWLFACSRQCDGWEADLAWGSSHFLRGRTRASLSASHAGKHWATFRFADSFSWQTLLSLVAQNGMWGCCIFMERLHFWYHILETDFPYIYEGVWGSFGIKKQDVCKPCQCCWCSPLFL